MDRATYIKYLQANAGVNILFEYSQEFGKKKMSILEFTNTLNFFLLVPEFHNFMNWVVKYYNNKFNINFLHTISGELVMIL